jgi:hypothetical protein
MTAGHGHDVGNLGRCLVTAWRHYRETDRTAKRVEAALPRSGCHLYDKSMLKYVLWSYRCGTPSKNRPSLSAGSVVTGSRTKELPMLLRHHPLVSRHGVPNWPPVWTWIYGEENQQPNGEIGILKAVLLSRIQPADRCFLLISHQRSDYIGCLLSDDRPFCKHITGVLRFCCNRSIAEIGSLDLAYTL